MIQVVIMVDPLQSRLVIQKVVRHLIMVEVLQSMQVWQLLVMEVTSISVQDTLNQHHLVHSRLRHQMLEKVVSVVDSV